ncbi:hypothetical protein E1B28_011749 [Marasmius oreades]|uniref:Uncharacterized protein n=1 Tax=Marasmius oreades TaxID=181124 RepID=A0A9P7RVU4_9AGAR|nr:uncharacterized protein E1B28_011749 [Marasmius oreades]KAG7090141.1 hypothetical protein E1B28_011749 [Marasmius oreades]
MSSTPSLILCGELVPVAHIEGRLGLVGEYYVKLLRRSLGCSRNELWMDFRKGRFCRGPVGPRCRYSYDDPNTKNITVPLDLEFLEEEVIIRYLLGKQDDRELFYVLSYTGRSELLKDRPTTNYSPHVLSDSTGSMISFCQNLLWWSWKGCLDDRQLMPDGATRLRLTNNRRYVEVSPAGDPSTWLSQALSVFHSHNISLDEDLSTYQLIYPYIKLAGKVQKSKRKQRRRRLHAPIYLFLLPSPFSCRFGRRFYSWSLDPTGRIPLSLDMCKYLGLPYKLSSKILYFLTSWSTKTYKTIHNYQIARGFDPRTTDLAQTLRYQIHAIVPRENPFQEVEEGGVSSYTCTSREPLPGGRGKCPFRLFDLY